MISSNSLSQSGWTSEFDGTGIKVIHQGKLIGRYVLLKEPYCHICAFPDIKTEHCSWHQDDTPLDRTYSLGVYYPGQVLYDGDLTFDILKLKRFIEYSVPLGLSMALCAQKVYPELLKFDYLVPVPSHSSELKVDSNTGTKYNQSKELTKVLNSFTGIKIKEILVKTRPKSQRGLTQAARKSGMEGLYVTDGSSVKGLSLIIVDDVRTSGATGKECATALKAAGASKVVLFVAGR